MTFISTVLLPIFKDKEVEGLPLVTISYVPPLTLICIVALVSTFVGITVTLDATVDAVYRIIFDIKTGAKEPELNVIPFKLALVDTGPLYIQAAP